MGPPDLFCSLSALGGWSFLLGHCDPAGPKRYREREGLSILEIQWRHNHLGRLLAEAR